MGHGHSHLPPDLGSPAPVRRPRRDAPLSDRVRATLVALVVVAGLLSAGGMALLWPSGDLEEVPGVTDVFEGVDVARGVVVSADGGRCPGTSEDRLPSGDLPASVQCAWATVELVAGPDAGDEVTVDVPPQTYAAGLVAGDDVDLARYPPQPGVGQLYVWVDHARDLPLTVLTGAFALLVVAVARLRGLASLLGLAIAYATIFWFMLPALREGQNPIGVGLAGSVAIMVVILYLAHGFSMKTTTALLGTVAGLVLTALLGWWAASATHLSGLSSEDDYVLSSLTGGGDLRGVVLCGIVVAGLGVLNDVTITQASAVYELRQHLPNASVRELFASGMRIGRDHLASTVYTIAFAYAGAALPVLLLIDLYDQPLGQVLTSQGIAEEIVRTVVGAMGLIAAVPLTTGIAALAVTQGRRQSSEVRWEPAIGPMVSMPPSTGHEDPVT
ncbi:YibE/F family protein [Thalassiella azotivora]